MRESGRYSPLPHSATPTAPPRTLPRLFAPFRAALSRSHLQYRKSLIEREKNAESSSPHSDEHPLQRLIASLLLRLGKVYLAFLGDVQPVFNWMVELLACEIEHGIAHFVEAMEAAVAVRNAIHLAAEDVLREKRRDGALPAGRIGLAPFLL